MHKSKEEIEKLVKKWVKNQYRSGYYELSKTEFLRKVIGDVYEIGFFDGNKN